MRKKAKKRKWELYIIRTRSNKLYTGITTDLDRRFRAHCRGKSGARFFRFSQPKEIIYRESHPNRSKASKREYAIKKMSRKEKLNLALFYNGERLLCRAHFDTAPGF